MRIRPTLPHTRENAASSRRHDSRFAARSIRYEHGRPPALSQDDEAASQESRTTPRNDAAERVATGSGKRKDIHLLTVCEVADLLRVPVSWVYERTSRRGAGQLPHLKLGKYLRFEERLVTDFIQEQRRV